jgi:hypothetical protein
MLGFLSSPALYSTLLRVGVFGGVTSVMIRYFKTQSKRKEELVVLEREAERLKQEVKAKEGEVSVLKKSVVEAQERLEEKEKELETASGSLHSLTERLNAATARLELSHEETEKATLQENELLREEAKRMNGRVLEMEQLLKVYMPEEEKFSTADVQKMVEDLNSEIRQMSTLLVDRFEFEDRSSGVAEASPEYSPMTEKHVAELLGESLTHLLQSNDHSSDALLVQLALQSLMCAFCDWIIESWYFRDRETEQLLHEIYDALRESGK